MSTTDRQADRERELPVRWTDPSTWSEDRLDEWAACPLVIERERWLRDHNGPF